MNSFAHQIVAGAAVGSAVLTPRLMVSCSSTPESADAERVRVSTPFDADLLTIAATYRT